MVPPHLLPVSLGQIVATPAALAALGQPDMIAAIRWHASGDWGEVDTDDRAAKDDALRDAARLFLSYTSMTGVRLWVITKADRSVTTVLLPDDY